MVALDPTTRGKMISVSARVPCNASEPAWGAQLQGSLREDWHIIVLEPHFTFPKFHRPKSGSLLATGLHTTHLNDPYLGELKSRPRVTSRPALSPEKQDGLDPNRNCERSGSPVT